MNKTKIIVLSMLLMGLVLFVNMDDVSADSSVIYVNATGGNDGWDGQNAIWNGTSGPKASIKSGATAVTANGTVNIANGVYSGSNNRDITLNKNMVIKGQSKDNTIIDGSNGYQIFVINSGVNISLLNVTIRNAKPTSKNGGAIQNNGGTLTVNNCKFNDNSASRTGRFDYTNIYGGAIYSTGTLNIINSSFNNNVALSGSNNDAQGGAIYSSGPLNITDSIFTNNNATSSSGTQNDDGGAIAAFGTLKITRSTFTNNRAGNVYGGGALMIGDNIVSVANVEITESTFTNNTAGYGGAIWINGGTANNPALITKSIFTGNSATEGGAIRNWGFLNVIGSDFTGNSATQGSAINNNQGTANINFNRIIGNTGSVEIYRNLGTVNATNNWWGSNTSPSAKVSGNVDVSTWLVLNIISSPNSIYTGNTSTITADLTRNQNGVYFNPANGHVPDGILVNFAGTLGSITSGTLVDGSVSRTFTAGPKAGTANITATVDVVSVISQVQIKRNEVYVSPNGNDVTGDGSSTNPFKTIGVGMATVASGGNLYIMNGTYNERNIVINKNVTITGQNTASTIIDAQKLGRIFNITSGSTVVITNLTLVNGSVNGNGGAIYNAGNLTLSGSDLRNNTATVTGGTIYNTGSANIYFNRIIGTNNLIASPSGTVIANNNWWDSNSNPSSKISGNVIANNWIVLTVTSSKNNVAVGENSTITADLTHDNTGVYLDPSLGHVFDGININFNVKDPVLGVVNPKVVRTVNGSANTIFTGVNNGVSNISVSQDDEIQNISVKVGTVNLWVTNYAWFSGVYTYNYKQQIVMLVQLNNLGNSTATGIVVKYVIGSAFRVVSYNLIQPGTLIFDNATNTFTWIIDRLEGGNNTAGGSYASFSVLLEPIKVGSGNAEFMLNSSIESCDQLNIGTTKSRVRNLVINPAADVQVTQTVSNNNPKNGDYVTIKVIVKNNGPSNATNVSIYDLIPSGLYVGSLDPNTSIVVSMGNYNQASGIWDILSLNNGTEAILTIVARVDAIAGTQITNRAYRFNTPSQYDWNTGNDATNFNLVVID